MSRLALDGAPPLLPAPPPRRPRLFRLAVGCLRAVATLHAVLAVTQALTIGRYLDGSYAMIRWHGTVAGVLILVALALSVVALAYSLAGGRWWVAAVCVPFFLAEGVQTGMGYGRALGIHIPLGVAIVGGALVVAAWAWTRAAARPRVLRRSPVDDQETT